MPILPGMVTETTQVHADHQETLPVATEILYPAVREIIWVVAIVNYDTE